MAEEQENVIQRAEGLLQAGKVLEARSLLVEYIQQNPVSAAGWWLLSLAVTEPKQQMDCLEWVLTYDPNYSPARVRLEKLKQDLAPKPSLPFSFTLPAPAPSKQNFPSVNRLLTANPAAVASRQPRPLQPASKAGRPSAKSDWILPVALFIVLLCVAGGGFGFIVLMQLGPQTVPLFAAQSAGDLAGYARQTLPPTWTATITNTPLPSPTFISAATPAPINKLVLPIGPFDGYLAPGFVLKDVVTGSQVGLANYSGRPVVILFWATWCPHCANEMSAIQSVYRQYQTKGLAVLALDVGESATKAHSYRSSHNLTFIILNDSNQTVASQYHVTGFPTNFFVRSSGQITSIVIGEMNAANLNSEVASLFSFAP